MLLRAAPWLLAAAFVLVAGCSPSPTAPPSRTSEPTPSNAPSIDSLTLTAEIERAITTGSAKLDNVRAVLVSVDGETEVAHYRHGFAADDHRHVFSVTKSVVSLLIGTAIADGLITSIDQPLSELLPEHRQVMNGDTAAVTLRQLLTMSGGFDDYMPVGDQWKKSAEPGENYVELLLARPQYSPGTAFYYSDPGSHLVAAVLAAALDRAAADRPRTVLDYARERLFDPLSISTRPALSRPFPDLFSPEFVKAGFGWATDPNGIQLGAAGLRLTAPDMIKIGELCRRNGVWNGQQVVPADWLRQAIAPSPLNPDYGLLWWLLGEPQGPGYMAAGAGGQQIVVLPSSRAVIVYLSEMRRDSEIVPEDLEPLNAVLAAAFP